MKNNTFVANIHISALFMLFLLSGVILPAQRSLAVSNTLKLTSGVFVMDIERKIVNEDQKQITVMYVMRLTDQGGENLYNGADIKFESYAEQKKEGMVVKTTETQPGIYVAELTFIKDSNWGVAVLGVHDPYPFRAAFYEVFLPDKETTQGFGGVPVINNSANTNEPAPLNGSSTELTRPANKAKLLIPVVTAISVILIAGGTFIFVRKTGTNR